MALKQKALQRKIDKFFAAREGKFEQTTTAILGNSEGVVFSTETEGLIYARLRNGDTIEVFNDIVPDEPELRVKIGRTKEQPDLWRVIARRESYSVPQSPRIKHHHKQHEFIDGEPGPDTTWIGLKQVMSLTAFVLTEDDQENFIVTIIGDIVEIPTGYAEVSSQTLDLSSHIPTTGARYVTLQFDEDGELSVVEGDPVDAPELLTLDAVPLADEDKFAFAYVELHADQEKLLNKHIRVIRKFFGGGSSFTSATWGNITGTLSDQTDLQAALDGKADIDHDHSATGTHFEPVTEEVEKEFCHFDVDGALAVVADASVSILVTRCVTLSLAYIYCKNNGSASSTIVDVNVDGTTIFTTSANRPELGNSETYAVSGTPDIVELVPGNVLSIDIDQIATGADGLTIVLTELVNELVYDGNELVMQEVDNE